MDYRIESVLGKYLGEYLNRRTPRKYAGDHGKSPCGVWSSGTFGIHALADEFRDSKKKPTVVVMDAHTVNGSGLSGVAHLRQRFPLLGIVVIAEKIDDSNHVQALQEGADHFLPKPLNLSILSATVASLYRRLHIHVESAREKTEVWKFNRRSQILSGPSDVRIEFSDRESVILTTLFLSPHFPVSIDRLFHSLNMPTKIFDPHRIDMIIYRIRKKLVQMDVPLFEIRNVYGQGYMCIGLKGDAAFYVWDGQ